MKYVALIRGINVGGNNLIKMSELRSALDADGISNVRTYIQSGNILFTANESELKAAVRITNVIEHTFSILVQVVVMSYAHMKQVVADMPAGWGSNPDWKYNTLFLIPPCDSTTAMTAIGTPKPYIESIIPGKGVIYQSVEFASFGKTTGGKVAANPIYKQMTVRNYNTTIRLLQLLNQMEWGDALSESPSRIQFSSEARS